VNIAKDRYECGAPDSAQPQKGNHTEAGTDYLGWIQRHCSCVEECNQESSSSAGAESS